MANNTLRTFLNRYRKMRNAPDAIMIRKDFNTDFSIYRRDRSESPIWSFSNNGQSIEFSVIDAAFIIGVIAAVVALTSSLSCLYYKIRYIKRW